MLALLALTGVGFWAVTKATELPKMNTSGDVVEAPAGISDLADASAAQDAREVGFIGNFINRKASSVYAYTQNVLDPQAVSITQFDQFKTAISKDHVAFQENNLRGVFDHDYERPLPPRLSQKQPLIGVPHAGAEITSGQNLSGTVPLFGSNPYTYQANSKPDSALQNASGYVLAHTYGTNGQQVNYDRWGEARMSWNALGNPWRPSGVQYQLQSSWLPPDKDQLTGKIPVTNPRNVFQANGYPTQVVAPPPQQIRTASVFNRQVKVGGGRTTIKSK